MQVRKLGVALCIGLLLLAVRPGELRGETKQKPAAEKEPPIEIVSDRLEAYNEKRMVVFSGNAVATQGARTIRADRLTLYYREQPQKAGRPLPAGGGAGTGGLDRVEAKGRVTISEGDRIVTGDEAVFDQSAQRITMTGRAVLREGGNVIQGERVVVFIDENRGVVEGTEGRRVTATIYPGEQNKR